MKKRNQMRGTEKLRMTQSCGGRGDPWGPDIQRESERTRGGKLLGVRSKHRAFQKLKASKGEERQSEGGRKSISEC